jgi:hypothetical protein
MVTTFKVAKNNAASTLSADCASGDLAITVANGGLFPSTFPFPVSITNEIMLCTNRVSDILTVARAQESTIAASHSTGDAVELLETAIYITELNAAVNAIEVAEAAHIAGTAKSQHTAGAGDHTHATTGAEGGTIDHGVLTGMTDDDHTQYTKKATLTEKGDIYYASAASTPAALAHGATAGSVLQTGGHAADPSWRPVGIADNDLVEIDDAAAADNDYAKFTPNGIEGVPYATVLSDIGALDKTILTEQGDIIYASAASTPAALAHGTDGQYLKSQGHGANPIWATIVAGITTKIITITRANDAVSGDVSYTGVGFEPKAMVCLGATPTVTTGHAQVICVGMVDENKTGYSIPIVGTAGTVGSTNVLSAFIQTGSDESTARQTAVVKSYDADGFTLTWTQVNTAAGTASIHVLCIK